MDIYASTLNLLLDHPVVRERTTLQDMLRTASKNEPRDWRLPVIACRSFGGEVERAIPAAAAVACLQFSIILVDDMLDADPRGEHHRIGSPAAANLAMLLNAIGLDAIARSNVDAAVKMKALDSLNRMMLTTAHGQFMDVQGPEDEEDYWRIVRTKSSPFFGSALYVGALMGGADSGAAAQIERLGHLYGELIQIHDDLNDAMATPANPDWTPGHSSLPILFAQGVDHVDRARFVELRQTISDPASLKEAQTILIRCGAVSYCIDQILHRYKQAQMILGAMTLHQKEELADLFYDVVRPVEKLFEAASIESPEEIFKSPG